MPPPSFCETYVTGRAFFDYLDSGPPWLETFVAVL
jgi:hypothetical protein